MDGEPLYTKIEKFIQTRFGEIVLESPKGFPRNESNLYLVSKTGKIVWKAERPDANTLFSRVRLLEDGDVLSAYTMNGHACDLDISTGRIISQTKMQ